MFNPRVASPRLSEYHPSTGSGLLRIDPGFQVRPVTPSGQPVSPILSMVDAQNSSRFVPSTVSLHIDTVRPVSGPTSFVGIGETSIQTSAVLNSPLGDNILYTLIKTTQRILDEHPIREGLVAPFAIMETSPPASPLHPAPHLHELIAPYTSFEVPPDTLYS